MIKQKINWIALVFLGIILFSVVNVNALGETVGTQDVTVCCEKTNSGLYCQDVPEEDCSDGSEFALPTSCASTTPCNPGYCYDSVEGTCLDNVPQMICTDEGGTWSAEKPGACNLGCCILGDQASFATLVRCKRLSNFYSLETNWNSGIANEVMCILAARSDEKGACVFEHEFETTCKLTTRSECTADVGAGSVVGDTTEEIDDDEGGDEGEEVLESPEGCQEVNTDGSVKFCPGMLCSAEELETNCGPSRETSCLAGREEVYFVDTCGNPANIYDGGKINNDEYWSYIKDKSESCSPDQGNANSQSCGNCNYLLGSYCSVVNSETASPTYGESICKDLNCPASEETGGEKRLHGESWCGFDSEKDFTFQETSQDASTDVLNEALSNLNAGGSAPLEFFDEREVPVGSKFYRYLCSHGEVLVEPCADFRNEECIENNVAGYSEAACRVNRWQTCTSIYKKADCENTDRVDCIWLAGIEYVILGGVFGEEGGSTIDKSSLGNVKAELKKFKSGDREMGSCVPRNPPGLQFWGAEDENGEVQNDEATAFCAQANAVCPVTYEKGLIGGDWECIENCECLETMVHLKRAQLCMSLGDCGPKMNIAGQLGRGKGYKIFEEDL
ncbi:MAG: hypothetical protein KJ718_02360 [Nanoarchaeota archaeon]|nr:hypothetical protein [Nanoarchaeota archaeon]MBU1051374.1 hypothetical protein [Nanoarchaeota archaeon]MBU1988389.1 hypothetical protein [Nanoarchaeota archaeon]